MRYALLIYDRLDALADLSDADKQAVYSEYQSLSKLAGLVGHRLQSPATATTLRIRANVPEFRAGPLTGSELPLAGFYLLDTGDPDQARRSPAASQPPASAARSSSNHS